MDRSATACAGWYGKLPCLGDFTTRHLPGSFTQPWDRWLQRGLRTAQATHGEQWEERCLASPFWRFVLTPGLLGPNGWIGVLMPSVDRVGRPFPFTVACPLPPQAGPWAAMRQGQAWFEAAEETMLACLRPALTMVELAQHIATLPAPGCTWPAPTEPPWQQVWPAAADDMTVLLDGLAGCTPTPWTHWLAEGRALHVCAGLPDDDGSAALWSGVA